MWAQYRQPTEGETVIDVRVARPEDNAGIRDVHPQALYPSTEEARLVELLRQAGKLAVSLVAVLEGVVAGHVAFSPASITPVPDTPIRMVALGPLGVLPT